MKPEDINRAIAEHCGWINLPFSDESWPPSLNYHGDLNAMHEAEKVLDDTGGGVGSPDCLRYAYSRELYRITPVNEQPMRATASDRSKAFLRTVGKWKDQ